LADLTAFAACEELMTALEECHAKGLLWKSLGMCSKAKQDMNMCLRAERLKRQAKNREEAKAKKEKMKQIFRDIDENS
jgi:COX assembly mitochondrial protein 2